MPEATVRPAPPAASATFTPEEETSIEVPLARTENVVDANDRPLPADLDRVDESPVRCFDAAAETAMIDEIKAAAKEGDSLGGVVEVLGYGVPIGLTYEGVTYDPIGMAFSSQIINDLPLGRSMDEIIRLFDALQFHTEHGEVCPANWKKGDKGMDATPAGVAKYLSENADKL